jgi:anti-sigma regulatory factor (Ser/Thr protein kinase)
MSVAAVADEAREHAHIVGFYRRDEELLPAITTFLGTALSTDGAAVVIATPAHRAALDATLASEGFSIDALRRSGRYRSLDARETLTAFMRGGRPDAELFASVLGPVFDELSHAGGPLHAFGEMVALLWDDGDVAAAIELESLWNDFAADHTFALYCAYAMSSLEASSDLGAAKQVCDRHSRVVPLHAPAALASGPGAIAGSAEFTRLFVPAPVVVREVRSFVRDVLRGWGEDALVEEAEIIALELATNAVVHACSPFQVSISRTLSGVTIAVRDASPDFPRHVGGNADRLGGRGIALVASLSQVWDTRRETDGKTVWAMMARATAAPGRLRPIS